MNLPYFSFIYFEIATLRNITSLETGQIILQLRIKLRYPVVQFYLSLQNYALVVDFWSRGVATVQYLCLQQLLYKINYFK